MIRLKTLTTPVVLRRRSRRRPLVTSVAERFAVFAVFVYAAVIVVPWWARALASLGALVAAFNVVVATAIATGNLNPLRRFFKRLLRRP